MPPTAAWTRFGQLPRSNLGEEGRAVIVNYLREGLGQQRGGHHSPLAAYDPETDQFLILDVARYKYPPVWVSASKLFDAMNTPDRGNQNRTRGYVLVRARAAVATKLN
jgi:Phytochelatin synthase